MLKNKIATLFTVLFVVLLFSACGGNPSSRTETVNLEQGQASENQSGDKVELGEGTLVKFITSEGNHETKERNVRNQIEQFVNGGEYEIVSVTTTRCNSTQAHLLSAEIYYRVKR